MLDMAMDTFKLVLTNKLFLNPVTAYGLMALGVLVAAAVLIVTSSFGVPALALGDDRRIRRRPAHAISF